MVSKFEIRWSYEASENLGQILNYIETTWGQNATEKFKVDFKKLIDLIAINPNLFPKLESNPEIRRAILNKQTKIYYKFRIQLVEIIFIYNSKQDIDLDK